MRALTLKYNVMGLKVVIRVLALKVRTFTLRIIELFKTF